MYSAKNIAYILTSLEAIEKIRIYTKDIESAQELFDRDDQLIYNACLILLMTIGEETGKIDQELKDEYSDVPWQNIKGMRNRIAHDYRGLDPTITIQCDQTVYGAPPELFDLTAGQSRIFYNEVE